MSHKKTFGFELSLSGLSAKTGAILVDLSDTTNFKHSQTGRINVYDLFIEFTDNAAWDGVFEIGYLENVDGDNGDFVAVYRITNTGATQQLKSDMHFHEYPLLCHSNYHATDGKTLNDATFQTDVAIPSSIDRSAAYTTKPGDGDLAVLMTRPTAGTVSWNVIGRYGTVANV